MPSTPYTTTLDHCRIGSLESELAKMSPRLPDHCRIGSLEIIKQEFPFRSLDHCRIGSLESASG